MASKTQTELTTYLTGTAYPDTSITLPRETNKIYAGDVKLLLQDMIDSFTITSAGHSENLAAIRSQHILLGGEIDAINLPLLVDENGDAVSSVSYNITRSDGGALPSWVMPNFSNPPTGFYAVLRGTPDALGTTNFLWSAREMAGKVHTQAFSIQVSAPPVEYTASYGINTGASLPASPSTAKFTGNQVEIAFPAILAGRYYAINIPNFAVSDIYNKIFPATGTEGWTKNGSLYTLRAVANFDAATFIVRGAGQ